MGREVNGGLVPSNYRDASNTSGSVWKKPPTRIPDPATSSERLRHSNKNPFSGVSNDLNHPRPGNPNVGQTVLSKAAERRNFTDYGDYRPRKRPKHDASSSSSTTFNFAPPSHAGNSGPRGNATESDTRMTKPPPSANRRNNPPPNGAEVIDLNTTSEELGERVPRAKKSSSPDPMNLGGLHDFETHPAEYRCPLDKGKGRARVSSELVVEGSEEEEDESIEDFTPPPSKHRQSNTKAFPEIQRNIVKENRLFFENPAVKSIDLTKGGRTLVSRMKRKDEGVLGHRKSTGTSDPVGTSSSKFLNSPHEREKILTLPLEAWCLGFHLFQHSESTPLELVHDVDLQQIRVVCGSPPEKIEFKLGRNIQSTMIVNEDETPLKEDLVIQFTTAQADEWGEADSKYKGFGGGDRRGKAALTFLFSTAKDRGFTNTTYQKFVTRIRKALTSSAVEILQPSKGKAVWDFAARCAEMFEITESRQGEGDRSGNVVAKPSVPARSVTPCSSTTGRMRISCPEPDPLNGDSSPSASHRRSARQSAMREKWTALLPPPPVHSDPDEVILLYPPTGTGALSIMQSDLRRLQPEEYLNDTLIEFGLKLWLNDLRATNPALAEQIHVFSSFFYKKLNNKKNPEDGYKSVRKWTSKVDLFTKKYVIVPINENIHWYLAIIYEPGHTLEPPLPHSHLPNTRKTRKRKPKRERAELNVGTTDTSEPAEVQLNLTARTTEEESETDISSVGATCATTPNATRNEELDNAAITVFDKSCSITARSEPLSTTSSEIQIRDSSPMLLAYPPSDGMDVDILATDVIPNPTCDTAEVLEASTSNISSAISVNHFCGSVNKSGDVIMENEDSGEDQQQEAEVDDMLAVTQSSSGYLPPKTYIFTLDSLGTRHPQAIKVLKQYLKSEAKDKRSFDEVREAVGKQVQVPVQPNSWDCGIYLQHFVKVFMSAPSEFMERILSTRGTMPSSERKEMWQEQEIPQYRDFLTYRITQLSKEWRAEKTAREEATNKRKGEEALEAQALSSEGEVDIVEDTPSVKPTPAPRQRQPAMRLRG